MQGVLQSSPFNIRLLAPNRLAAGLDHPLAARIRQLACMDPADADPAVQRGRRHRQFPSQVREQPLLLTQESRFRHDARARTAATTLGE